MSLRAVVLDDEQPAREYLKLLLERTGSVEVVAQAGDADEFLRLLPMHEPDVAFLDICLPGMSGIDVARILSMMARSPRVVFVTGYDEYAVRAFELAAVDYVMKPLDPKRLNLTVSRLLERPKSNGSSAAELQQALAAINGSSPAKLPIRTRDSWKLVEVRDIVYVKTEGRKLRVQTRTESYLTTSTLGSIEKRLEGAGFFRANEGCIVNLDCIQEVVSYGPRTYELLLNDARETFIPLSRSRARKLRELMNLK